MNLERWVEGDGGKNIKQRESHTHTKGRKIHHVVRKHCPV